MKYKKNLELADMSHRGLPASVEIVHAPLITHCTLSAMLGDALVCLIRAGNTPMSNTIKPHICTIHEQPNTHKYNQPEFRIQISRATLLG